jgi:hypothetical protein
MIVILAAFYLGSRLIRIEYESHRENWEDDGKPADYFWRVPGSYLARMAVSTSWLLATPDWMKGEPKARRIVVSTVVSGICCGLDCDGVLAI